MSDLRPLIRRPGYQKATSNDNFDFHETHSITEPSHSLKAQHKHATSSLADFELDTLEGEPTAYKPSHEISRDNTNASAKRLALWQRMLPLLAIAIPTAVSTLIAALTFRDYTSTSTVYSLAMEYRTQLQVVIHIVSAILVLPWSFAICTAFNFWTRTEFWRRPANVYTVRLWAAISRARLSVDLPMSHFLICAAISGFLLVPGFLWTGALTPVFVEIQKSSNITVMAQSGDSWPFLTDSNNLGDCLVTPYSQDGWATTCPGFYRSGALLESVSSAITVDGRQRNHSKPDNSGFQYSGRSYGAGVAVGLSTDQLAGSENVHSFSYIESSYDTNVSCSYNASSLWVLTTSLTSNPGYIPNIFFAQGYFPNSNLSGVPAKYLNRTYLEQNPLYGGYNSDYFSQAASGGNGRMLSMGSKSGVNPDTNYVVFAAGSLYHIFDNVQCALAFEPRDFNISVSTTSRVINVTPGNLTTNPEPHKKLLAKVMNNLGNICQQETTMYLSAAGNAFNNSFSALWANRSTSPDFDHKQARLTLPLEAVEQSVAALVDDILVWNALYGVMMQNGTTSKETKVLMSACRIGSPGFALALFIMHAVAFMAVLAVSLYTRLWHETMLFDYADPISLSASVLTGAGVLEVSPLRTWGGDPKNATFARLKFDPAADRRIGSLALTLEPQ